MTFSRAAEQENGSRSARTEQVSAAYERLIERFVRWAEAEEDIRVSLLIGSRARTDKPADEWSDADIVSFARRPEIYLRATDWLSAIGNPLITFLERTATGGGLERRAFFEGGLDADFPFFPMERLETLLQSSDALNVLRRGYVLLIDKDKCAASLLALLPPYSTPAPPTQQEFDQAVHDFWYHVVWTAKKFARGELLMAKSCADSHLKGLLVGMSEWHARSVHGWDYDTWHTGRFFEAWADSRIVGSLQSLYALYDRSDIARALRETMDAFRWVANETAGNLELIYPAVPDRTATEWVETWMGRSD